MGWGADSSKIQGFFAALRMTAVKIAQNDGGKIAQNDGGKIAQNDGGGGSR